METEQHAAPELHTIPVSITDADGAIRVHNAPYDEASAKTKTIGTNAVKVLTADHHRAVARLVAPAAFLVAFISEVDPTQDLASMALWPAQVPLPITAVTDVWVAAPTGTVSLSIITERTTETTTKGIKA